MKLTTEVWAKFESKGYPEKTIIINGTMNHVVLEFAKWIREPGVYLVSKMSCTIAKTEDELHEDRKRRLNVDSDFESEMNRILEAGEL